MASFGEERGSGSGSGSGDASEGEDSSRNDKRLDEDFYSMLNVPKDANEREITQAYHRLGLIYHPDKHKDAESKRNAELLFAKLKRAYDVLMDPHKRAIYDSVGMKGLEQEGLQIVVRSKTPQEIREEYERLAREKQEREREKLTNSTGYFAMNLDATKLFDNFSHPKPRYLQGIREDDRPLISLGNFEMQQSIDLPITDKNFLTLSGNLHSDDAHSNHGDSDGGNGSVSATLRRILASDAYLDFKATVGVNRGVSVLAFKRLSSNCHGKFNCLLRYKNGQVAPIFVTTLNYQLDTHLIGQINFKTGVNLSSSSMSTALIYQKENFNASIQVQLSLKNSFVSLGASRAFLDNNMKLKASTQLGYLGLIFSYGIEKQLTKFTHIDASMVISTLQGVVLNLEVERGTQRFIAPIVLSHEILPSAIFYGTIAPIIGYFIVKKLIIDPYVKERDETEAKRKQERLKAEIAEKRRLALAAQNLMKEAVYRVIEKEGPNGLIIKRAIYGKLTDCDLSSINPNSLNNEKLVDVTIPLQFLVINHSLQIVGDQTKSLLEGFYDPCIGEPKSLYIEYTLNGEQYEAQFDDQQIVRLPKATHKKQWWSTPFSSVRR